MKICADQLFQSLLDVYTHRHFLVLARQKRTALYDSSYMALIQKIYALMLLAMVPITIAASPFTQDFQTYHPTVRELLTMY